MNEATQTGVAMAAIAAVCTVAGALLGWLKERDKLQFDAKLAALQAQNTNQESRILALTATQDECEEGQRRAEDRARSCEEKHATTESRLSEIERIMAAR